jgi:signal transduction histidine kinase
LRWEVFRIRCRREEHPSEYSGRSSAIDLERTLFTFRWAVAVISLATLLIVRTSRQIPFLLLVLAWIVYTLLGQWYLAYGRHKEQALQLFPIGDGAFTVTALLMVDSVLNPFTPLFCLTVATVAMRLPVRQALPLGALLLLALAVGLHAVSGGSRLDWGYVSFVAFNLLIMGLVAYLVRRADRLEVSLDDLNTFLHRFPCGVILEDEDGLYANAYTLRSLGLPVPEGRDRARTPQAHARVLRLWQAVQEATPRPDTGATDGLAEVAVQFEDGWARTYLCRRLELTLTSGATANVATLIDVTREREMHRRLQEQERLRLIGTLTATAIHEVRNPLAAVRATAQLISLDKRAPTVRDHALRITAIIDELHSFLDRLMDLGRIPVEPPTQMEAGILLREVSALMTPVAQRNGVSIRIIDEVEDLHVACDPYALRQVLINLVQNGIDAMNSGGVLTLRASQEGRSILVSVTDQGEGIPPEVASRIFDPFYTTKERGTGLGLVISRQIIEEHQGRLWFETSSNGTTFYIRLPGLPAAEDVAESS